MRGLWDFILLGFIFQFSFQLGSLRQLPESDELADTSQRLNEFEEFEVSRENNRKERLQDNAPGASGDVPKPGELFEGDIIMDESLREAVLGEADKRSVLKGKGKLWPENTVPVVFDTGIYWKSKSSVLRAIRTFHRHTCIKFKKRDTEKDFLFISSRRNMCSSYVGRKGGKQDVSIGKGCTRLGTCQHELMHALGTIHEQSRPDRDQHIDIKWENIREGEQSNFRKYSYQTVTDEGVEYDFRSVMHYPNYAFAKDISSPTIVAKNDPHLVFGQRKMFTSGDVEAINKLYGCKKDVYARNLPSVLSDEEVKERRDMRERFDLFD